MDYVRTKTELAAALGVTPSRVSQMCKLPWWPPADPDRGWAVEATRKAIEANVGQSRRPRKAQQPAAKRPPPEEPRGERKSDSWDTNYDEQLLGVLKATGSSALERAQALTSLLSHRLALVLAGKEEARTGDVRDLKQALEELRKSESDYLDLEERRRTLIPRDEAKATAALVAQRLVNVVNGLKTSLATQSEVWRGDPDMGEKTADERRLVVQEWVDKESRGVLEIEVEELLKEAEAG